MPAPQHSLFPPSRNKASFAYACDMRNISACLDFEMPIATGLRMDKLIDEFRKGWQGEAPPSLGLSIAFAVACLLIATLARWGLAHVRPDVYFTPYFPAVLFATAFGG